MKIHRVLPDPLRRRVEALETALGFTTSARSGAPVAGDTVLLLAEAVRRGKRVRMSYQAFSGERTRRELSPYGLVVHAGRWYLAAHDHLREDLRTFRIDRMSRSAIVDGPALPPPEGFDAVAHVSRSLASVPWGMRSRSSSTSRSTARRGGCRRRWRSSSRPRTGRCCACAPTRSTGSPAMLAGLGCDFTIREPDELRASVHALAERLAARV